MPQRHMDEAVFRGILARLSGHSGITVSLQGEGEPTLHPQFWPWVAAVREAGHRAYTITNGSRVDAALFDQWFDSVGVSIDTVDATEAERIGRHNVPKVLANFEALLQAMGPQRVVVHTVQYGQPMEALVAYLRGLGVQRHVVQPLQVKDDYQRHYGNQLVQSPRRPPAPARYQCGFLDSPRMRYFDIQGTEMPCCFIKDTALFTSIDDLRHALAARQVPPACAGCRELR